MPDDHSEVVPLLPIPNRTVKRFCADDSADSRVKVGHRQASQPETPSRKIGRFFLTKITTSDPLESQYGIQVQVQNGCGKQVSFRR